MYFAFAPLHILRPNSMGRNVKEYRDDLMQDNSWVFDLVAFVRTEKRFHHPKFQADYQTMYAEILKHIVPHAPCTIAVLTDAISNVITEFIPGPWASFTIWTFQVLSQFKQL